MAEGPQDPTPGVTEQEYGAALNVAEHQQVAEWNVTEWHGKMLIDRNGEKTGKLVAQHTTADSDTYLLPIGHMLRRVLSGPASRLADDDELSCSIGSSAPSVSECDTATVQRGFIVAGEHRVQEWRGVRGSLIHAALTGGRKLVA
jgi:hypothetical protein